MLKVKEFYQIFTQDILIENFVEDGINIKIDGSDYNFESKEQAEKVLGDFKVLAEEIATKIKNTLYPFIKESQLEVKVKGLILSLDEQSIIFSIRITDGEVLLQYSKNNVTFYLLGKQREFFTKDLDSLDIVFKIVNLIKEKEEE